jgi:hypothetical protein
MSHRTSQSFRFYHRDSSLFSEEFVYKLKLLISCIISSILLN